jgi:Amino acid synthesis
MKISIDIRRRVTALDTICHERGPRLAQPIRRGWSAVVIANPFAGRYVDTLVPFMDSLEPLAAEMTQGLLDAMRVAPGEIESYGKGTMVGVDGEMEHAAIWHAPGGAGIRRALGFGAAAVPGSMKVGTVGATLDISLGNVDAPNVRSHYDSIPVFVDDAPRPAELVLVVALATGGRPHARLGSLIDAANARMKAGR